MPWTHEDALRHTHKANTPHLRSLWAEIANQSLSRDGDEAKAIREANSVIDQRHNTMRNSSKGPA